MAASADGFITKHEDGLVDWTAKEDKKFFSKITKQAGVLIYGNKTFETFNKPLPGRLNIVMTRTPDSARNEKGLLEFTNEEPDKLIARLDTQGFKKIIIAGGPQINKLFLDAGLVDEMYLTIEPIIFGSGKKILPESKLDQKLELIGNELLNDNVILLKYRFLK